MRRLIVLTVMALCFAPAIAAAPLDDALREAARLGDLAGVEKALAAGAAVDAGDRYHSTALYLAARAGHLQIVRLLAERGADVNAAETFYDSRPLDTALDNGFFEVAKALLGFGAESREGALAIAVRQGDLDLLRAAVESGPIYRSSLERLLGQASDQDTRDLLSRARSRPDPPPPTLAPEQLDRFVGRYEGWSSETFAEASRQGDHLVLRVNQGLALEMGPVESGVVGMVETTFRSADGSTEASFWGRYGSVEGIYLSFGGGPAEMLRRSVAEPTTAALDRRPSVSPTEAARQTVDWPSFRGSNGDGIGDGTPTPVTWNVQTGEGVLWKADLPGLANSSPVVWGERVFVTTAIATGVEQSIRTGDTGSGETVADAVEHSWQVLAFEKKTGKRLWATEVGRGVPLTARHFKATQANSTPAVDGKHLVVVFPTAGIACLNLEGEIQWHHALGGLNAGAFMDPTLEWGFASSPVLYQGTVILQVDVSKGPVDEGAYLAAWNVENGSLLWKTPRDVAPSFSTPTILPGRNGAGDELVVNASTIHGYDPKTGNELWSLGPNSELVVARPVPGDGVVYVSAGYAPVKPIYAIFAGSRGKLEVVPGERHERLAWSQPVGGAYMPTPLLYRGLLYVVHHNGRLVAYDAASGEAFYKSRFSRGGAFTGSPVVVNGKIYVPTEEGLMYVVAAGVEYKELAINDFDEPLMATPAVSEGTLFVRTPKHLYAIGDAAAAKSDG